MIINKITFFKVPFDNGYKNVFDIGNYQSDGNIFDDFISENFFPLIVAQNINKSVKITNNDFILSVYGEYSTLINYNYAKIETPTETKYYFITNFVSDNDGNNSSVTISLEYDVWHNNIDLLANTNNFDENFIERRHENRYTSATERKYNTIAERLQNVAHTEVLNTTYSGGAILWNYIRVDNACYTQSGTELYTRIVGSVKSQSAQAPIIANPVGYYDYSTKKLYPITAYRITTSGTQQNVNFWTYTSTETNTHILASWLSFNMPYQITYDVDYLDNSVEITFPQGVYCGFMYEKDGSAYVLVNSILQFAFINPTYFENDTLKFINDIEIYGYYKVITTDIFNPNIAYVPISESKLYTFPYNYRKCKIREWEYIIKNEGAYDSVNVYIDSYDKSSPLVYVEEYGKESYKANNIQTPSQCIIAVSQMDLFNRNNSESAYTGRYLRLVSGALNNFIGGARGGAVGIGSAVGKTFSDTMLDYLSFNAKLDDIEKQQDSYNIPSYIAQNDTEFQDNLVVYDYEMYNTNEINTLLSLFRLQGYAINNVDTIRYNSRIWFDYVKTQNCNLPFINNIINKKAIEQIYDNGVTRWHINTSAGVMKAQTQFNTNVNNPERDYSLIVIVGTLGKVLNPSITGNILLFTAVENAEQYNLVYNDEVIATASTNSFDLSTIISQTVSQSYILSVYASTNGYENGENSETVTYSVYPLLNTPSISGVTEVLNMLNTL